MMLLMVNNSPVAGVGEISVSELEKARNHPANKFPRLKKIFFLILTAVIAGALIYFLSQLKFSLKLNQNTKTNPDKFALVESSPSDSDNNFPTVGQPSFVFSKKISLTKENLNKYFSIEPKPTGSWHLEKNSQVVYFSSDKKQTDSLPNTLFYDTLYTIKINKNISSLNGEKLSDDIVITFKTKKDPKFGLETDKKLIVISPNQPLDTLIFRSTSYINANDNPLNINFLNSKWSLSVQTVSTNQFLEYFSYKEGKKPFYQFKFSPINKDLVALDNVVLESGSYTGEYKISLGESLNNVLTKPGLYFFTLKNSYGKEDFFVSVTSNISQVYTDANKTIVWTTDKDGKNIENAKVDFYNLKNSVQLTESLNSDNKGLVKTEKNASDIDFVITKIGEDLNITKTDFYNSKSSPLTVFSYSDRPVYKPGDVVHYKAVIRKKEQGAYLIPEGNLYLKFQSGYIDDSKNYKELMIDKNGTVNYDLTLPKSISNYPQIILFSKNKEDYENIDSLPLNIQAYKKPDMDISVVTSESEYISKDIAHFTVFAKTLYGKPFTDIDFSYRVIISNYSEIKDRSLENIEESVSGSYGTGETLASGTGKFDSKGKATIEFSTDLLNFEQSELATIEITPNIGASPSIGKIVKLIHRGEFALFFEDVKGDSENGISGTILSMDHNKPRKEMYGENYNVSLYKVIDYQDKNLIEKKEATPSAEGLKFIFPKVDEGNYELVVNAKDKRGNIITSNSTLNVAKKKDETSSAIDKTLEITTEKESYKPGEKALVKINANFQISNALVITSAADANLPLILSFSPQEINSTSFNIPIEIGKDKSHALGVDIFTVQNGTIIRGHGNIKINNEERKIVTKINFDKKIVKPGDSLNLQITTKDNLGKPVSADTSLSVIDNAILQIGELNGNIFNSFYSFDYSPFVASFNSRTGISLMGGGGAGGCFLEGTKITLADKTSKNIEELKIGDKIQTRESSFSKNLVSDTITKTFRHIVSEYITVNNSLNVTPIHRIFINNSWKQASEAKIGDLLLNEQGNFVKVNSLERHFGQFTVYNLTTEKTHTFFANGFYVHNEKGPGPRKNFADTAYWNPHIQTNQEGIANVSIKVPDNLTTFTAQSFSNTSNSLFGQTTAEFISQKDLTIIPIIPNFYYQNDKGQVSALIQNSTDKDLKLSIIFSIKETGISNNKDINVAKGGFEEVSFPVETGEKNNSLSFLLEAKENNKVLDSVLIKKDILPKGNVEASWLSFEGSKEIDLTSSHPNLDFNNVSVFIVPHIANEIAKADFSLSTYPSANNGKNLFAAAYVLSAASSGKISPDSLKYASLKNNFREAINAILEKRIKQDGTWWSPTYQINDSMLLTTLWITKAIDEATSDGLLNEIKNISEIKQDALAFINKQIDPKAGNPNTLTEEIMVFEWLTGDKKFNKEFENNIDFVAVDALLGNASALEKLKKMSVPSADDRYVFDGPTIYSQVLPVLALVEKGSKIDSDKAIKGLSINTINNYFEPLVLVAGLKHIVKNNLSLKNNYLTISVNGETLFNSDLNFGYNKSFSQVFPFKNIENNKIKIKVETKGNLPVYTSITQFEFSEKGNQIEWPILGVTKGKIAEKYLERSTINIENGETLDGIKPGKSAIAILSLDNLFAKVDSFIYSFTTEDAISPYFMFLNQQSGNSPQYQGVLDKLFPSQKQYQKGYFLPNDFSDEAVYFNGIPSADQTNKLIFAYPFFNLFQDTSYQPKTSLVFPNLGIIVKEK